MQRWFFVKIYLLLTTLKTCDIMWKTPLVSLWIMLAFILIPYINLSAQDFSTKYGKITDYELALKTYLADTTANAIVLYKKGVTNFEYKENQFRLKHEISVKIKIMKPEGTDYANVCIPYYNPPGQNERKENISDIEAISYNLENGKVVKTKMNKEYLFKERVNEHYMQAKFSIPNAKNGSVVEYRYMMISDYYYMLDDWEMQQEIPVIYSEYDISIPAYFRFSMFKWGVEEIEHEEKKTSMRFEIDREPSVAQLKDAVLVNGVNYVFKAQNLPALKEDSHIWHVDDYKTKVNFELLGISMPGREFKSFTSTWEDVDKTLLEHKDFGKLLEIPNPYREEMRALGLKELSLEEKVGCTFRLLKQKISWNEKYRLYGENPEDILKKRKGSNADINFLLISMLREAGIIAEPVILSKRDRGVLPKEYPSLMKVNTFVVGIRKEDDTYLFVDGSVDDGFIQILPPVLLVEDARILNRKEGDKWVDLSKISKNSNLTIINATINEEGLVNGVLQSVYSGQYGINYRKQYLKAGQENRFIEQREAEEGIEITEYKKENKKEFSPDITEYYSFIKQVTKNDSYIYVNPMIFQHITKNPFIQENRKLPIEFPFTDRVRLTVTIKIPDNYTVEEIPKQHILNIDKSVICRYLVKVEGNQIQLTYSFDLHKRTIPGEDYQDLSGFWSQLVNKSNEFVVLKKRES